MRERKRLSSSSTYPVVLVCSDGCELSLRKRKRLEVLREVGVLVPGVDVYHMEAGLIPVHRVQNNLEEKQLKSDYFFS